jgi:hypothetical protein
MTYDSGSYFALKWKDTVPAYTDSEVFTIPSTVAYIGEYALLDVGRDITYNGYLIGWDFLTAAAHTGLSRTVDGSPVTVTCLDGTTQSLVRETLDVRLDSSAKLADGILYGGYYTYCRGINEDYYAWLKDPAAFAFGPDQFITVSAVFGKAPRVLTTEELEAVRLLPSFSGNSDLTAFAETFNRDPAALYAGKSVVMVYLRENSLCRHTVTEVVVSEGKIHVILTRSGEGGTDAEGKRFLLIPVRDPEGELVGAEVSFTVKDE